jgi:DNA-binding transcriptional LysR family regulator
MQEDFRLRVFVTLAEQGSFTLAAKTLGISQPAVSQHITALEKSLGTELFSRNRGEVTLTDAGRSFMKYAEKILYWYSAANSMFGESGSPAASKPVMIDADPVSASYILPPALSAIAVGNPEIAFTVGRADNADLSLTVSPSPGTMDFDGEAKVVGIMDAAAVASASNPTARTGFSTLAGVHVSNSFAVWDRYLPMLTTDLRARVSVVSPSVELVKSMVMESDSLVGVVPSPAVRRHVTEGSLVLLPAVLTSLAFDIHFDPSPAFMDQPLCRLLRQSVIDSLQ